MSLDFNNAQEDVQRIIDNSTGQFKKDFEDQADDFVKVAQDSKVITDVTVNATAVESMTATYGNRAGRGDLPRHQFRRRQTGAARVAAVGGPRNGDGGQIKMAKVEFVP